MIEEIKKQENNLENKVSTEVKVAEDIFITPEQINNEINNLSNKISENEEKISVTTNKVNEIRHDLRLEGEEKDIPSIGFNQKNIVSLKEKKIILENKLSEILKSDVSSKYTETINQVKQSKIDWANSPDLSRRLKLKGLDEDDVRQVKEWLINNAANAKTFVLPSDKYKEAVEVLSEITNDESIKQGSAFYAPGGRDDIPENLKNSVFIPEKPTAPPIPGVEYKAESSIDKEQLSHELGHATQDGLLDAEQFKDGWNPKFKDNAPDKKYVGQIQETDTRIRSMFNILGDLFNPEKEVFGKKHINILKDKLSNGTLGEDTKDLLNHYSDVEIIKMANRMPAI